MQLKKMGRGLAVLLSVAAMGAAVVPAAYAQQLTAAQSDQADALALSIQAAVAGLPAGADADAVEAAIQGAILASGAPPAVAAVANNQARAALTTSGTLTPSMAQAFTATSTTIQTAMTNSNTNSGGTQTASTGGTTSGGTTTNSLGSGGTTGGSGGATGGSGGGGGGGGATD
jgi:hypothetical protein